MAEKVTFTTFEKLLAYLVKQGKVTKAAAKQQLTLINMGMTAININIRQHYDIDRTAGLYIPKG